MAVTFLCSIAMLQSAIQIAGDGGARVKLDIPDSEMDAITRLMGLRGEVLRVTVELESATPANRKRTGNRQNDA